MRRMLLLACVAIGIAPGTWLRSPPEPIDYQAPLAIEAFTPQSAIDSESLTLEAAWRLKSTNTHFGGYSALIALDDTALLAGSDKARLLRLPIPGVGEGEAVMGFMPGRMDAPRELVDMEALTRDPVSGTVWAAYENTQTIERHLPDGAITDRDPPEMRSWPQNGGPEVLLRLNDGRFLAMAESSRKWFKKTRAALLFPGDPIQSDEPLRFSFRNASGLSPVDATELPDGRVMLLLRDVVWRGPIRFRSALAIADPAEIKAGERWPAQVIARFEGPGLDENFEGLAAVPREDGGATLYVIADDNFSPFQETVLLQLAWGADEPKASPESKGRAEQTARP